MGLALALSIVGGAAAIGVVLSSCCSPEDASDEMDCKPFFKQNPLNASENLFDTDSQAILTLFSHKEYKSIGLIFKALQESGFSPQSQNFVLPPDASIRGCSSLSSPIMWGAIDSGGEE